MLDFIDLSATGVAKIAESTNLKGCPHTFVCIYSTSQKYEHLFIHLYYLTLIIPGKLTENTFSFTAKTWGIVTGERRGDK